MFKIEKKMSRFIIAILVGILVTMPIFFMNFYTPKNSLELYQSLISMDDFEEAQEIMLEGYEINISREDFQSITTINSPPTTIKQFTVIQGTTESYILETTPGKVRLKVLNVERLPEDIKNYFDTIRTE